MHPFGSFPAFAADWVFFYLLWVVYGRADAESWRVNIAADWGFLFMGEKMLRVKELTFSVLFWTPLWEFRQLATDMAKLILKQQQWMDSLNHLQDNLLSYFSMSKEICLQISNGTSCKCQISLQMSYECVPDIWLCFLMSNENHCAC